MSNVIFYSAILWSMLLVFVQRFSFQVSLMLAPIYRNDKSACAFFLSILHFDINLWMSIPMSIANVAYPAYDLSHEIILICKAWKSFLEHIK